MIDELSGFLHLSRPTAEDPPQIWGYVAAIYIGGIAQGMLVHAAARKLNRRFSASILLLFLATNIACAAWYQFQSIPYYAQVAWLAALFLCPAAALGWFAGSEMRIRRVAASLCVIGLIAASIALAANTATVRDFARLRASRINEQQRLETAKAEALQCIAELKVRSPEADADRDLARGDSTPIGISDIPHDPLDPSTSYPLACRFGYTGFPPHNTKWLASVIDGFSRTARPEEESVCQRARRAYVQRYNRRMVERAPNEVQNFCWRQRQKIRWSGHHAAVVMFGAIGKQKWSSEGMAERIGGVDYWTKPDWLLDTNRGPVLVTLSRRRDSAACPLGESCGDALGLAYFEATEQGLALKRRWPIVQMLDRQAGHMFEKSFGDRLTISGELSLTAHYGTSACTYRKTTLIEVAPEGPIKRGVKYDYVARDWKRFRSGEIDNVVIGKSFDVVDRSSNIVEHYRLIGGKFIGPEHSRFTC